MVGGIEKAQRSGYASVDMLSKVKTKQNKKTSPAHYVPARGPQNILYSPKKSNVLVRRWPASLRSSLLCSPELMVGNAVKELGSLIVVGITKSCNNRD